jgi:cytochrome c-type biogenesis protein CcmH/NrfG
LIEEGIDAFRKAIQAALDPARATSSLLQSLVRAATITFRQENYERAINLLKAVLTLDPNSVEMWSFLSRSYRRTERHEEALEAARHLADLTPTNAESWYVLGKRYAKLGQTRNAAEAFTRALELDPNQKMARKALTKLNRQ